MRGSLVSALVACATNNSRPDIERFVEGLSADEMQFIAEFLGSCMLESAGNPFARWQLAMRVLQFQEAHRHSHRPNSDDDHKMILLLEYLCRSGIQRRSMAAQA